MTSPEAGARERFLRAVLDEAGAVGRDGVAGAWLAATDDLLRGVAHGGAEVLATLAAVWPLGHPPDGELQAVARAAARRSRVERLASLEDGPLAEALVGSTEAALAAVGALRDDPPGALGGRVRALFPELAALAVPPAREASIEHERPGAGPGRPLPLVDHLERTLERKLLGLERRDRARFQRDEALGAAAFDAEAHAVAGLVDDPCIQVVRAALLHLDFAKGGSPAQREAWRAGGVDLTVHNVAAREIMERSASRLLGALGEPNRRLALALIESHGLTGQSVRGETPLVIFAPFVRFLRGLDRQRIVQAVACLHTVNICDTAAVREGLLDDTLR